MTWLSGRATVQNFTINCAAPVELTRTLGNSSKFPDLAEKGEGLIVWTGSVNQRQVDVDDWDALLNATGFAAVATWTSDSIIQARTSTSCSSRSATQLTGSEVEELSNKRRLGAISTFRATNAGATSVVVTLVNATADDA